MVERMAAYWRQWPKTVRLSAGLAGSAVMLAMLYSLLTGTPQPVPPSSSLFEPVSIEQTLSSSRPKLNSFDFTFRPVFALTRKPAAEPDLPSEEELALARAKAEVVVVENIDGVTLLGIFGSGEVTGAIIRLDNGERQRLTVGMSVKGWTLKRVEPRRVHFESATGSQANLDMVFSERATVAVSESRPAVNVSTTTQSASPGAEPSPERGADLATGAQGVASQPVSFSNFYGGAPAQDSESTRGQ